MHVQPKSATCNVGNDALRLGPCPLLTEAVYKLAKSPLRRETAQLTSSNTANAPAHPRSGIAVMSRTGSHQSRTRRLAGRILRTCSSRSLWRSRKWNWENRKMCRGLRERARSLG
jgi:hypothetical protein